jgi:hypothetical protein
MKSFKKNKIRHMKLFLFLYSVNVRNYVAVFWYCRKVLSHKFGEV